MTASPLRINCCSSDTTIACKRIGKNDADIEEQKGQTSFLGTLLQRMNPRVCLGPVTGNVYAASPLESVVPNLLDDINSQVEVEARTEALRRLYTLTDLEHKENRVPLVCTDKWNVVETLANVISAKTTTEDRRLACLILNNLSIPFECKSVMVLGPTSELLLGALCSVIRHSHAESYLCCICLFNLSFLEEAVEAVINYAPTREVGPLENQNSLLRTIEFMMKTYSPLILSSKVMSVEGEAVRWATGLIRNLTAREESCELISETVIPELVCLHLKETPNPLNKWTKDSLEDLSLMVLCNLAKYPESLAKLRQIEAMEAVEGIVGQGGIHDFRAAMVQCSLESHKNLAAF